MTHNYIIKNLSVGLRLMCGVAVMALMACNDKLDEVPDNRTEIDTPEKVQLLLTSGYPSAVPAVICELSGDNLVDNNVVVPATHNDAYAKFHEEAYRWDDITNYSTDDDDTPYAVWEAYYQGIAVANHAIDAMLTMSSDPAHDPTLSHSWGEAHLLRGYLHFILVNVFAEVYKDETQSSNDWGIPYVTETETTVAVDYSDTRWRKSVAEVYQLIEKDILEGIDLIDDSKYKVPAYHFNTNAAHAFAARFYLFKREYDKAEAHATIALGGDNPSGTLRKWASMSTSTINAMLNSYNDEQAPCNFLIQSTYSLQDHMLSAKRYAINTGLKNDTVHQVPTDDVIYTGGGPNWNERLPAFNGKLYIFGSQDYGTWLFRVYEYFEFTDKIAGIGFVHILYQPFTAEETLLCRAEARLYQGNLEGAVRDLGYWTKSKLVDTELTLANITSFYSGTSATNDFLSDLHPQEMSPEFRVLTGNDLSVLYCILHFRRVETMFEGQRWFDIKRYGITVHHYYRGPQEDQIHIDSLTWDDPRRVLQIPNNVIKAGYPSNDRSFTFSGGYMSSVQFTTPTLAK